MLLSPQPEPHRILSGRLNRETIVNKISEYTNPSADETSIETDDEIFARSEGSKHKLTAQERWERLNRPKSMLSSKKSRKIEGKDPTKVYKLFSEALE